MKEIMFAIVLLLFAPAIATAQGPEGGRLYRQNPNDRAPTIVHMQPDHLSAETQTEYSIEPGQYFLARPTAHVERGHFVFEVQARTRLGKEIRGYMAMYPSHERAGPRDPSYVSYNGR